MGDSRVFTDPARRKSRMQAGIISKIRLENFMCHSNLEIEFGYWVNFITGQNGSGKSGTLCGYLLACVEKRKGKVIPTILKVSPVKCGGPRLLGRFPNGRVEEFIRARTLTVTDLRDPEISALIATKLREFHNLNMIGPKVIVLWDRLRNYLKEAKRLSLPTEADEFRFNALGDESSCRILPQ